MQIDTVGSLSEDGVEIGVQVMTRAEALGQGGCAMWMCDVHGAMRQTSTSQ